MYSAREIYKTSGYANWENFQGAVLRAKSLIDSGYRQGVISETSIVVPIGSGAFRKIRDFEIDPIGLLLITELTKSFKTIGHFGVRNETAILGLVSKYYQSQGIEIESQQKVGDFVFDIRIGNNILLEYDEPHHTGKRQKKKDTLKNILAEKMGYLLVRCGLSDDVIDIILRVNKILIS